MDVPRSNEVRIGVVTGTEGDISLHSAVRLVKPALLYADRVVLYSPIAATLMSSAAVGLSPDLTLDVMRTVGPLLNPDVGPQLAKYDALLAKKHKTRREVELIDGFRAILTEGASAILAKTDELVEEAGGVELIPAMEAGLLELDPIVREGSDVDDDNLVFNEFMERLQEVLRDAHGYPLFDDQVGSLVRSAVAENAFEIGASSGRRGKQVTVAARFMEQLPAFPNATIQEILDVREELRSPLVRFRAAIIEMERLIESPAHGADFEAEANDLFAERVAPALLEIEELVRDNSSLRQLAGAAVADAKTILMAAGITFGVTTQADLSHLVAAALDVAVPLSATIGRAVLERSVAARDIERHQLFFLYRTNALLRDPS